MTALVTIFAIALVLTCVLVVWEACWARPLLEGVRERFDDLLSELRAERDAGRVSVEDYVTAERLLVDQRWMVGRVGIVSFLTIRLTEASRLPAEEWVALQKRYGLMREAVHLSMLGVVYTSMPTFVVLTALMVPLIPLAMICESGRPRGREQAGVAKGFAGVVSRAVGSDAVPLIPPAGCRFAA